MTVSLLRVRIYTQITVQLEAFFLGNFTKSLVILKREALKNLKENTETAADYLLHIEFLVL